MCPGVRSEGWLRWSAQPFGGAECRGHAQCPAFAPSSSEVAVGFLVFLYLVVHNLPQLDMHTVIFSPLWFLCILLLEETFVQVQALQQRVPGPRSQPVSGGEDNSYKGNRQLGFLEGRNGFNWEGGGALMS